MVKSMTKSLLTFEEAESLGSVLPSNAETQFIKEKKKKKAVLEQ